MLKRIINDIDKSGTPITLDTLYSYACAYSTNYFEALLYYVCLKQYYFELKEREK